MAETVKVSLIQPRYFRAKKGDEYIKYPAGIQEMPVEHARSMGLLHRVVREVGTGEEATVVRDTFAGVFDERLTRILNEAGYEKLADLRGKSQDELLAVDGIGPQAYERIVKALKGAS